MKKSKIIKPPKKTDKKLWETIESKIQNVEYIFSIHAKERQCDRNISDIEVLDILENKAGRNRKRNKMKDTYKLPHHDWAYCIEGNNLDGYKIRIIISFDNHLMLMITVIRLD